MPGESGADEFEAERTCPNSGSTELAEVLGDPVAAGPHAERQTPNAERAYALVSVADSGPGLDLNNWIVSLTPFTLQSLKAWEWGCRSAVLLLELMEGGYGRGQMCRKALCFNLRYRLVLSERMPLVRLSYLTSC